MATKNAFPIDDLVKNILTKQKTIPTDLILLFGFVGEGTSEETIILYFGALLFQKIELAKEDILHSVKLNKTQSVIGGTLIWLSNAAKYGYKGGFPAAQDQHIAQHYLGGSIYQQYATWEQRPHLHYHQSACCR